MTPRDPFAGKHEELAGIVDGAMNLLPLFSSLGGEGKAVVGQYLNVLDMDVDEAVFLEGEPGDYVCFVLEGCLQVSKNAGQGKRTPIAQLTCGQSIGEMALVDNFPRSANVVALEKTRMVTLTRKDFETILRDNPPLGIQILTGICQTLSANLRNTSSRLADYLLPII